MTKSLKVLVSGATGNQGGAVVRSLLKSGHSVIALTRNPDSSQAQQLRTLGAETLKVNLDDKNSVLNALNGVDTFYLMGSPQEAGVEGEVRQGVSLADAAREAGVGHLVYGSVANADQNTGIPHFDSKYAVEKHIASLGVPYTITAPVFFMDNVIAPWSIEALKSGNVMLAMPGNRNLQQVSVRNIGEFVTSVIERRESVFGKRFDFAGDELSGEESAKLISNAIGNPISYQELPLDAVRAQSEDMAAMFDWFVRVGYNVDLEQLHNEFPEVAWQAYDQWVGSVDWSILN